MNSQRILLIGGLLLFLLSIGCGVRYDGFSAPELENSSLYNLDMALNMATKGDLGGASAYAREFTADNVRRNIHSRMSVHLGLAAAMVIGPLWLSPQLTIGEGMQKIMASLLVCGGLILATGDLIQADVGGLLGRFLVIVGYAWLALGLGGYFLYAGLDFWLQGKKRQTKLS